MEGTLISQKETVPAERPWPPPQGQWTYEDWLKLPDDGYRYEVIDGVLYMTPPPRTRHQRVSARLARRLLNFVEEHALGEVLYAPVGVQLPNRSVPFQPDILFIRAERLDIIGEKNVEGAPDLIVEILSPSNWLYDRREKMQVYQEAGVAEYWIVDPRTRTIEMHVLEQGTYLLVGQYGPGEVIQSQVVPGFEVRVDEVFPD
ncbi:MAG: Uma2 family endonuclease [Anaerolineae bacterium]